MSILTGPMIREQIKLGNIEVDPYTPENVGPNSIDLTLGSTYARYKKFRPPPYAPNEGYNFLDPRVEEEIESFEMGECLHVLPNHLYLLHTVERVGSRCFVPYIDGKSSIGRLGVMIHLTAGRGDTGFFGQWTLEVACVHPTILYPGMKIAQMTFHTAYGEIEDYKERGNYVGERATGPVASQSWRQFKQQVVDDSELVMPCYICEAPTTESKGARSIIFEDDGKYRWLCWECRVGK